MSADIYNSDLPSIKIKILNWVRSNPGYTADQASRTLSVPLNVIHKAVVELKQEGLLQNSPTLKLGLKRMS